MLQQIVLVVNRWPCGVRLTRIPYRLAVRAVIGMLRKYPLVCSAYARNSYALGTWVPGRSDIDLTLILHNSGSLQSELTTVRRFWQDYARLQRWFPMLGEVEILNEAHLEAWTKYAITGYEARHWVCLWGPDRDRTGYGGGEAQWQHDRLSHAIGIYCHQMTPVIRSAQPAILLRHAQKILRYLDEPQDACGDEKLARMTRVELQATIVQKLESKVQLPGVQPGQGPALKAECTLGQAVVPVVQTATLPAVLSRDAFVLAALEAVFLSPNDSNKIYFIPRENLGMESLMRCIATANAGDGTAMIMPRAVLQHYLQCVDPLEHLALLQNRTLLWGSDLFAREASWSEAVFHQAVCAAAVNILTFPYTRELEQRNPQNVRNLLLGWVLRIARYFQDGVVEFDYDRLLQYWQQKNPQGVMDLWQNSAEDLDCRFMFLRAFTDILCAGMLPAASTEG